MKYTICGFSQQKLLDAGLDIMGANILRWFIDFYATDKMVPLMAGGKEYVWVKYGKVAEDLPVLGIKSVKQIARYFDKFCAKSIMEKQVVKRKGTYTCFRLIGNAVNELQSKPEKPGQQYSVNATNAELDSLLTEYLEPNKAFDGSGQKELGFGSEGLGGTEAFCPQSEHQGAAMPPHTAVSITGQKCPVTR